MWFQFETVQGTIHFHRVKSTLDVDGIATHLEGLVEIEDAGTVALSRHFVATENPVLARTRIGNEAPVLYTLAKSVHSIIGGVGGGHANGSHKDE